MEKLRIPQATDTGYIEVPVGGVFDWSYPKSATRRGRYSEGLCPTLMSSACEIYYFEGVYEAGEDR